jgi:hypothetical protein
MDENDSRAVKRSLERLESNLANIEREIQNLNKRITKELNWVEDYSFAKQVNQNQQETISVLKDILHALVNK